VSDVEKARASTATALLRFSARRQVWVERANVSEPLMRCRNE